jgi:hypothetical protein
MEVLLRGLSGTNILLQIKAAAPADSSIEWQVLRGGKLLY